MRGFCMGALGWSPRVTMQDATLEDIEDAAAGYAARLGVAPPAGSVTGAFLQQMINRFPDKEKT